MKCGNCGNIAIDQARFCNQCGSPMVQPVPVSAAAAPSPATPAALAMEGVPAANAHGPYDAHATAGAAGSATFFERVKNMLLSPRAEWARIAGEPSSIGTVYLRYAMPLTALMALLSFVHLSLIGTTTFFGGTVRLPAMLGLGFSLYTFVGGLVGLFLLSVLINLLAPSFGARRELRQAVKVAAYCVTPACVGSVFAFIPGLGTLLGLIAGLYALYLMYLGLMPVMRTPEDRALGYTATVFVTSIICGILLGIAGAALGGLGLMAHLGSISGSMNPTLSQQMAAHDGAQTVGNAIGGLLGSDSQGKAQLGAAIENLGQAGAQVDRSGVPANAVPGNAATVSSGSAPTTDDAQNVGAAVGGLLGALGGALNGGRRVEPVDFHTLKSLLPESLPDMQRRNAEGSSKQAMGIKGTSATGHYQGSDGASVDIDIADAAAVSGLINIAEALPQTTDSSGDSGFERDVTVAGFPAHEKYDAAARHAELSFLLAKRFTVDLTGEHVDMSTLEADALKVDLRGLAAMKDAGAN